VSTQTKRAYRYRFYPTPEQVNQLARTFGCVRFVYNWGLATRKTAYFQQGKSLFYNDLAALLPLLKKQYPFLAEVSSVPIQQALRHLERAYVNFFEGRADYPVFKKKRHEQSATYAANAFTWDGSAPPARQDGRPASHCLAPPASRGGQTVECHRLQR